MRNSNKSKRWCITAIFQPTVTLYLENSPADALYILHAGAVKIVRSSADGRQQLLRVLACRRF
jgi:CRP-like cAMP-binding protein